MGRCTVSVMTLVRRELVLSRREAPASDGPESRVRSFVASTETVDSFNTVIKADGWELDGYARNGVVFFGHQQRELPIGRGSARIDGQQLLVDVDFFDAATNPLAEQALRILDQGVMGVSVGFEPLEWVYDESRETGDEMQDLFCPPLNYTRVKLVEVSVVGLPANPDAFAVGRTQARDRLLARLDAKRAAQKPPPAQPKQEPITGEQLRALVSEVVTSEVRAFKARRRGSLSGV